VLPLWNCYVVSPEDQRVAVIVALRRLRMTAAEIAECLGMALSTVSGILTRIGLGKLGRVGLEPAQRYQRARPGELIHIDVKKLGAVRDQRGRGGALQQPVRPFGAVPRDPLARGAVADPGRLGGRAQRPPRVLEPLDEQLAALQTEPG
jgi:hypothetical protein